MPLPARLLGATLALAATAWAAGGAAPAVSRASFGTMPDQTPVEAFTLTNAHGLEVRAITYGGLLASIRTPDRTGRLDDIVLGFDRLDDYRERSPYFGAIIGRYGNRIAKGRFTLGGHALHARHQRRPESPPRRAERVRQGRVARRAVRNERQRGRRLHARQPRRRRRLSRAAERARHLHADRARRAGRRLRSDDRRAHADQLDQPQLLQSRGRRARHPRPRADDRRRPLHADRRDADSHGRAGAGGRHAVRLPEAEGDRRADRSGQTISSSTARATITTGC